MGGYKQKVIETASYIKNRINDTPVVGLITGTGLGESAGMVDDALSIEYKEIPGFPVPTVQSHYGRLIVGQVAGKPVIVMQGRFHLYEGFSPLEITYPVRVMQMLGVKDLILSNAAGGLNPAYREGEVMVISDHINLTGKNPLEGPNENEWGVRFPDMTRVYDERMAALAEEAGTRQGLTVQKGIYAGLSGPSLETPAESRYLRTIGADAVGFSTVHEVITAIHAGIRVLGLSIITNVHTPDAPEPALAEDIIALAEKVTPKLERLIESVVENL
jgi:purine-nucleoside phosphorylase